MSNRQLPPLVNFTLTLIIIALSLFLLIYGRPLLIPLVVAIVIWYLIITLAQSIQGVPILGKHLSSSLAYFLAILVCFGVIWILVSLIQSNISAIVAAAPAYQERLEQISRHIFNYVGIENPPHLSSTFKELNFNQLAANFAQTATDIASSTGIIFIYVLFMLMEHHSFDQKLSALMKDEGKLKKARSMVQQIAEQVQIYVKIKTLASLLTGFCSYVVLALVGVDFADFWALMIALLNFIPTIGSIIATIFPCILTIVQFDSWTPFLLVAIGLTAIQFFIGNILEPRFMGKSFNLSALVILLSLAVWGHIWGIAGMFLCVPIMVIANIILANFTETKPIAILLSENGEIRES